jgi:Ca2+-transporting ATPase
MSNFYKATIEESLKQLDTNEKVGLKSLEADTRLRKYGFNQITHKKKLNPLKLFFQQFINPLIYILLAAVVISLVIQHYIDAIVIMIIVILNAILGFSQEYKAEKALELLKKMAAPHARVLRHGHTKIIEASKLVPGDILLLETGDKVPADARIIEAINLKVNEAVLTGESVAKEKNTSAIKKEAILADQLNMLFAGTVVSYGRGKAVVTSTGDHTEFGKIAESLHRIEDEVTPLQRKLGKFGTRLGIIAIAVIVLVFLLGLLKHLSFIESLMTSISLAVAAIPEGLPAVVTIALAIGVKRLVKNKALIRKLAAVETLGSTTVICSDKTGTITSNEMTVRAIYANNTLIQVSGSGYKTEGAFTVKGNIYDKDKIFKLLETAHLCNNSNVGEKQGDPTELALKVAAAKAKIKTKFKRIDEVPFDSTKKYMATLDSDNGNKFTHVKGAPEVILEMCTQIQTGVRKRPMTEGDKKKILEMNTNMASSALRVLGFAYAEGETKDGLTFLGLMGMMDPPREGVDEAIKIARKAGIRIVMITGDNAVTAKAISHRVGIKSEVITGLQLDKMSDEAITNTVRKVDIYARVNPEHKVKILEALQKDKQIVAMTGDGINDAPALKRADIGVSMGIAGTDVSKEASDMILMDDHFSTIVKAVEYGRSIYDNIKKFVKFLLSANLGEISIILFSLLASFPLPLLPLQILWINLVTDGLPALALGSDPAQKDIMKRRPRSPKETILHGTRGFIILTTIISTIIVLGLFALEYFNTGNLDKARTIALTTLIFFELFLAFSCRSEKKNIFQLGFFTNKYLVYAVLGSIVLHLLLLYTPIGGLFSLVAIGLMDWIRILIASLVGVSVLEIRKYFLV